MVFIYILLKGKALHPQGTSVMRLINPARAQKIP